MSPHGDAQQFDVSSLAVGMRNVFDASPPHVYNENFIFTDPGYDLAGRVIYARVGQTF